VRARGIDQSRRPHEAADVLGVERRIHFHSLGYHGWMSSRPNGDASGFMILSDADFERLTLAERVEYLRTAVAAVQRLQTQIQSIMEDVNKKPAA